MRRKKKKTEVNQAMGRIHLGWRTVRVRAVNQEKIQEMRIKRICWNQTEHTTGQE